MFKKLPSPKWMAFGCVVGALIGGAAYDRYEQNQIRSKYMDFVTNPQVMETNVKPRKVLVVVAPPPNDYLDTSLKLWRRWIKPILYANGLDYELVTGSQQGSIREEIASRIRALRKEILQKEEEPVKQESHRGFLKSFPFAHKFSEKNEGNDGKAVKEERFDVRNVLGIFYHNNPKTVVMEDSILDPDVSGGVICIGRGAYREYIAGVHEGILGPLEAPIEPKLDDQVLSQKQQQQQILQDSNNDTNKSGDEIAIQNNQIAALPQVAASEGIQEISTENSMNSSESDNGQRLGEPQPALTSANNEVENDVSKQEDDKKDADTDENERKLKPFITAAEYSAASFPTELSETVVRDPKTNVPAFFQQPILVIPVPNLSGFTTIPTRIMRFYQKRNQCEQTCHATLAMVESKSRPFTSTDLDLASYEELDWPKKWVEQGVERGSEWVQEFHGDARVMEKLKVIEPSMVQPLSLEAPNSITAVENND